MLRLCAKQKQTYNHETSEQISISLEEALDYVSSKFNITFEVFLKTPIFVNFNKIKEMNSCPQILSYLCSQHDLTYKFEKKTIILKQNYEFWQHYRINFFLEEKDNIFWKEIEMQLKSITNNSYAIDKYNGIISINAKECTQKQVASYLNIVKKDIYKQVLVECKVVEINTSIEQLLDLQPIIYSIDTKSSSITSCVNAFVNCCKKIYEKIEIKISSDMQMLIMSQQPGKISSSRIDFYKEDHLDEFINIGKQSSKSTFMKNEYGFSLIMTPLILNNDECLLKLNPSLSSPQKLNNNGNVPKNIQKREFNTVIKAKHNESYILGGLYMEYDEERKGFGSNFPILKYFINNKYYVKKKSYFVLFIKVSLKE